MVTSLSVLIEQVQADEYDSTSEADDRLRAAAPVLAAALKDALPTIERAENALRELMGCMGYLPTAKHAGRLQRAWDEARAVLVGEGDSDE